MTAAIKGISSLMPPELRGSRLLLVYLAVVGLAGAIVSGPLFRPIVNYLLLAGYAAVIRWWVREDKPLETHELPTRPRRDVAVIVVVVAVAIAGVIWFWFGTGPRGLLFGIRDRLVHLGIDRAVASKAGDAVVGLALLLLPAVVVSFAAGLRPRQLALAPRRLGLGVVLSIVSAAFGLVGVASGEPPLGWARGVIPALAIVGLQAGVNGIPEEFIFRGVVFDRLLVLLRGPAVALVLSSVLFNAFHIPSDLAQAASVPWWQVVVAAMLNPNITASGLIWGYLCYRTRSIWPGVLWHTTGTVFGITFW